MIPVHIPPFLGLWHLLQTMIGDSCANTPSCLGLWYLLKTKTDDYRANPSSCLGFWYLVQTMTGDFRANPPSCLGFWYNDRWLLCKSPFLSGVMKPAAKKEGDTVQIPLPVWVSDTCWRQRQVITVQIPLPVWVYDTCWKTDDYCANPPSCRVSDTCCRQRQVITVQITTPVWFMILGANNEGDSPANLSSYLGFWYLVHTNDMWLLCKSQGHWYMLHDGLSCFRSW